ncbi:phage tail assembly chaperone [Pseudomonas syringae]|uniref:phage tail assembly chaperone n=1 Tax=Pseudomonas syringae TaxID=317 RepID=UPI001F100AAA|nr:phage tail assembly chaperone [Pseudomonas syringae]MCH5555704.1 phage tail assembly chaperone [Pseudomonas syringae pv. syringae]MCH5576312.1 phage tail assembly chaperone [Pseudomonas syringae pv. syringae]MCH5668471.1 phage tail assembly chaperone [Pseudomonas syringae pv. syringae]
MAKIKIAQNPTFKAPVMIPRIGEAAVKVEFEFKYMDRTELAEMFGRWNKVRAELNSKHTDDGITWQEVTASEIALQVEQIKDVVTGWSFDDKFTDEAVTALVTTCVGAPQAVIDAYQSAYDPARLGN